MKYDENSFLTEFQEKPVYDFDVSMGIYCINRRVIKKLEKGEKYGFDNLMLDGIKNGDKIWIHKFDGLWLDIGRPEDYQYVDENYLEIKKALGLDE